MEGGASSPVSSVFNIQPERMRDGRPERNLILLESRWIL